MKENSERQSMFSQLLGEFIVIVLGVLVALGVDEWRDDRADIQYESEYLASLIQDLERDIEQYESARDFVTESVRASDHVLAVIEDHEPSDPLPYLAEAVQRASWVNYPAWTSGTLDELVNSGNIRLIRDPGLKRAILDYYDLVEEWKPRILGPEFAMFNEYRRFIAGWLPPSMHPYSRLEPPPEEALLQLDVELERRIGEDEELHALVSGMREDWTGIIHFMERFLERADALRGEVEAGI